MKTLNIYGSTGSIGTQALEIVRGNRDKFKIIGLTCGDNLPLIKKQIVEFAPEIVFVKEPSYVKELDFKGEIFTGSEGLKEFANHKRVDISLVGIVGVAGVIPTYEAIKNSNLIALANKESLVSAGKFIISESNKLNVPIIPVDSEHSAIFQSLRGHNREDVKKIILTASGGPFFQKDIDQFDDITIDMALSHPTWNMGRKITIDSSTLINKGLEIIEAKWLFDIPYQNIEVLIHPQSIVHSLVHYCDGALIAQLGYPDMKVPISYALFYPQRCFLQENFTLQDHKLEFYKPDTRKFPTLNFAYEALRLGDGYSAALNVANEVAVYKFLNGKIKFTDIFKILEKVFLFDFPKIYNTLEDVFNINREVENILS